MKNSHGFFNNFFNESRIFDLAEKINNFLDNQPIISNYYSDLNLFVPEVDLIIDQNLVKEVGKLIARSPLLVWNDLFIRQQYQCFRFGNSDHCTAIQHIDHLFSVSNQRGTLEHTTFIHKFDEDYRI